MTPKQIEIGDKLLKILKENGGRSDNDHYPNILKREGYDIQEIFQSVDLLEDLHLALYERSSVVGNEVRLLSNGHDAAEVGLQRYLRDKREASNLDVKSKKTGIRTGIWSTVFAGIAIIISILGYFRPASTSPATEPEIGSSGDKDSSNGHNQSDRIQHKLLISELIPEIANSLKHDSVFVKELAKELKRQQ